MERFQSIARHRLTWLLAILLMALTFNNWLLSPWLSPELFKAHAEVSEFSVKAQPHAIIFRLLDSVSGFLFIVCGAALYKYAYQRGRLIKAVAVSMVIFGISNIIDAIFRLPCSETISQNCNLGVQTSLHNFHIPTHGFSSVVIGACYLILPLLGALYCWRHRMKFPLLWTVSIAAVALAAIATFKVLITAITTSTVPTSGGGLYQEIQMSLFGLWFILAFFSLTQND